MADINEKHQKAGKPQEKMGKLGNMIVVQTDLDWYQDQLRRMTRIVFFVLPAGFALVILLVTVFWFTRPAPQVIAVTRDFRVINLVPLSEPYVTDDGLTAWVATTMEDTMGLTFVGWKKELSSVEGKYTSAAFSQLLAGLKKSGYLQTVVDKRLDARAVPVKAPYILQSGVVNGVQVWILKMSMQVTYSGTTGDLGTQVFPVQVVVERANVAQHPSGIVIRQVLIGG